MTRESAILGTTKETQICLNEDHSGIVRFPSAAHNSFKITLSILSKLVEEICSKLTISRFLVPFMPGKFFVGRTLELSKLRQLFLETEQPSSKSVALHGQSGVGKTQLGLKYAMDNRLSYDYVFFLNSSSMGSLRNELRKLTSSLQIVSGSGDPITDFMAWLSSQKDQRWLVIFDNANNLRDVMGVMTQIPADGHILITTQDARVNGFDMINEVLPVQMLSPEESKTLLLKRAGITNLPLDEMEVASELVNELGYLPLAIDSAGAYINTRKRTLQQYVLLFHTYQKDILDHRPEVSSYPNSVLGSLEVNFKDIDLDPNASALLSLLAFLDPAEVTEQFLKRGSVSQRFWGSNGEPTAVKPSESFVPEKLVSLITNEIDLDNAVERLTSLSLVTCTYRIDVGRCFTLHPLVHKCVRLRMTLEERQQNGSGTLCLLSHAYPSDELGLENG